MSMTFSDELLSAYLDGETTPEEKALVEHTLDEQPGLRERLSALSEASQSIQSLPVISAPNDLQQAIVDQLMRERTVSPSSSTPEFSAKQAAKRKRTIGVGSALAATLLFVCSLIVLNRPSSEQAGYDVAESASMTPASGSLSDEALSEQSSLPEFEADFGEGTAAPLGINGVSQNGATPQAMSADTAPPAAMMSGSGQPVLTASKPDVFALDRQAIARKIAEAGQLPVPGDSISVLTRNGEVPVVIDLTVVDVQEALGDVQFLLKNENMEAVGINDIADDQLPQAQQKLTAIYIDLEKEKMEQVLNQVNVLNAVVYFDQSYSQTPSVSFSRGAEAGRASHSFEAISSMDSNRSRTAGNDNNSSATQSRKLQRRFTFDFDAIQPVTDRSATYWENAPTNLPKPVADDNPAESPELLVRPAVEPSAAEEKRTATDKQGKPEQSQAGQRLSLQSDSTSPKATVVTREMRQRRMVRENASKQEADGEQPTDAPSEPQKMRALILIREPKTSSN